MGKVVVKILQGSAVTQTVLGGISTCIHPPVSNSPQCMSGENYESLLAVDKVIATISRLIFWPTCIICGAHRSVFKSSTFGANGRCLKPSTGTTRRFCNLHLRCIFLANSDHSWWQLIVNTAYIAWKLLSQCHTKQPVLYSTSLYNSTVPKQSTICLIVCIIQQ